MEGSEEASAVFGDGDEQNRWNDRMLQMRGAVDHRVTSGCHGQ